MRHIILIILLSASLTSLAQKKELDHDVYDSWNTITQQQLSIDGQRVVYVLKPGWGDTRLVIRDQKKNTEVVVARGVNPMFTHDSEFVVFTIKPQVDT